MLIPCNRCLTRYTCSYILLLVSVPNVPVFCLACLARCLLLDKVLLSSPYTDVWQLRRGGRWGPGEHVNCASHHPSTVFPFTPAANGPKLQETSHCCFSQSVTQAPCKIKTLFFFFFPLPSLLFLCSLPLSLCSSSVFSLCFGVKLMEFCLFGAGEVEN